jgi:hypothetical protein
MFNSTDTALLTRAQIAETDEAVLAFAVITRKPDRDVHPDDRARWVALEERLEIRAELAASCLL